MSEKTDDTERLRVVMERVEIAADHVIDAMKQGGEGRVKAALAYWFGVLYDEGQHRVRQVEQQTMSLKQLVDRLKASNKMMKDRLGEIVSEKGPDEGEDDD